MVLFLRKRWTGVRVHIGSDVQTTANAIIGDYDSIEYTEFEFMEWLRLGIASMHDT